MGYDLKLLRTQERVGLASVYLCINLYASIDLRVGSPKSASGAEEPPAPRGLSEASAKSA